MPRPTAPVNSSTKDSPNLLKNQQKLTRTHQESPEPIQEAPEMLHHLAEQLCIAFHAYPRIHISSTVPKGTPTRPDPTGGLISVLAPATKSLVSRAHSFASPARTHERNETISRSGDSVPLRSHPPTSDAYIYIYTHTHTYIYIYTRTCVCAHV